MASDATFTISELPAKASAARSQILAMIRSGQVLPGQALPPERELAALLGVNHRTIRRGLDDLIKAGLVVKRPRLGNFVRQVPVESVAKVALILPQWVTRQTNRHPLLGTLWNGVTDVFDQSRGEAQVHLLDYDHAAKALWTEAGHIAVGRGIKGVIVYLSGPLRQSELRPFLDSGLQVVVICDSGLDLDELDVPVVVLNPEDIVRQAVRRLVELGHRNIAMIHYEGSDDVRMLASVNRIWQECGLAFTPETLIGPEHPSGPEPRLDFSLIRKFLSRSPRPGALVVTDELIASAVFRCCYERDLRVPEDISLVSIFNNTPDVHPVRLSAPHTTRISYGIGRRASLTLQSLMNGQPVTERVVQMAGDIHWAESVAAPAG